MSDAGESGNIKEDIVEDENKVSIEATCVNLDCVKSEQNKRTLDFEEDNHSTQYRITPEYENMFGEPSHQIKIEEDYDNLIGFLDNDVIMENAVTKAVKEEAEGSFNNFHCSKCKGIYKGYCLMCSTLLHILNNNSAFIHSKSAFDTIPTDILEIRETSRGKGVYLLRTLPINIIFGPFEGILGIESTVGHSWKVIDNKLGNIKSGNWMKNIVCAASPSLKNLEIFQIDGNLYFQTNREITEGEEVLIYYDDGELQQLDNSRECLYTPQKQEKLPKIFACTMCCLGFGSNKCLIEHKRKCRVEHSRSMKEFVLIECHYCKMWMEKWEHGEYHVAYCLDKYYRMQSDYSEGVHRNDADAEEMEEGDCGTRADKRRYRGDICSRPKDRTDASQSDTKDYQCLSGGNIESQLNECGALLERSNNAQIQNPIETNCKAFKCDVCMVKYILKANLERHIKNKHTDDGGVKEDYKCSECCFQTKDEHYLKMHLKRHMKDNAEDNAKDYKCSECSYQTNDRSNFRKHLTKHSGIKQFQCDICMMQFTRKDNLKKHIRNKHTDDGDGKDYKCSDYKYDFRMHQNRHRGGIKPFQCDICLKTFNQKGNLTAHIKNKHTDDGGMKDNKCSECSYATNDKGNLQRHLNRHRGIKPFKCDICMMTFTEKVALKSHIKNKHTDGASSKDYKCSECFYQTNYKFCLQRHLNKHGGGIKPFKCDICMMTFTLKASLKSHIINKHTDDATNKDYKCLVCSYQTNRKSYLQKHLNKHKGLKPFTCDICAMKFTLKVHLKMHIKNAHADDAIDKDYKCSECSFQTNEKSDFQRHLNTHSGIKPFTCDTCMAKFARKANLTAHIKNKHTDDGGVKEVYKCSECSFLANCKSDLKTHLNKHRGIIFTCDTCMKEFGQKGNLARHIKNKHATRCRKI